MRYLLLATDYDGTLAHHGQVDEPVLAALERLRSSGRRLVMVTGREMRDLRAVFPHLALFNRIVAENGAVLFNPATGEEQPLAEPPPGHFVAELRARGVDRLSVGHCIVATWHPFENIVLETIRDLGLERQVIFNKGAVMVLPTGVNKASGLNAALRALRLSAHNAVGVGDAENDHAFMALCECSAAVANALPAVKDRADLVLKADHGAGVCELIEALLATDLADCRLRRTVGLGARPDGADITLPALHETVLIAGRSGSGKSSLATAMIEELAGKGYQLCVIDPEGDYDFLDCVTRLGTITTPPAAREVAALLEDPQHSAAVMLMAVPLEKRPAAFADLLDRLHELRLRSGFPHRLFVDEAHHLLPADREFPIPAEDRLDSAVLVTVNPESVSPEVLRRIDVVITLGEERAETLERFCRAVGEETPALPTASAGNALIWRPRDDGPPEPFDIPRVRGRRRRHRRKYSEGELPADRSFYFRGPAQALNLRAHNLMTFLQMADGVDDATWEYHRRRGDYSAWVRRAIKDEPLAAELAAIEQEASLDARASRGFIREAVERRYTAPS